MSLIFYHKHCEGVQRDIICVKGFWFLAKTQQKVVAIVTASQRFVYLAAYFVGFLYRVDKDIEDQRTEAELPPQKLYLPPSPSQECCRDGCSQDPWAKGRKQAWWQPVLTVFHLYARIISAEGCLVPLHLGPESVFGLPTQGATKHHGRTGF